MCDAIVGKKEIPSFNSEEQTSVNSYSFAAVLFMKILNLLQFFPHRTTTLLKKRSDCQVSSKINQHVMCATAPSSLFPQAEKLLQLLLLSCRDGQKKNYVWAQLEWITASQGCSESKQWCIHVRRVTGSDFSLILQVSSIAGTKFNYGWSGIIWFLFRMLILSETNTL